jgi:hypothetical protein
MNTKREILWRHNSEGSYSQTRTFSSNHLAINLFH